MAVKKNTQKRGKTINKKSLKKRPVGRPKGSKNKTKNTEEVVVAVQPEIHSNQIMVSEPQTICEAFQSEDGVLKGEKCTKYQEYRSPYGVGYVSQSYITMNAETQEEKPAPKKTTKKSKKKTPKSKSNKSSK